MLKIKAGFIHFHTLLQNYLYFQIQHCINYSYGVKLTNTIANNQNFPLNKPMTAHKNAAIACKISEIKNK